AVEQRVVAPVQRKVNPAELKSVTLLVTPQQVAQLTLGQSKGKLCLTLRSSQAERPRPPLDLLWREWLQANLSGVSPMDEEILHDAGGRVLGFITTDSLGRQVFHGPGGTSWASTIRAST